MNIALVGNNDGPLILAKSMIRENLNPVCIGLQKPAGEALKADYRKVIDKDDFFSGFDEEALVEQLRDYNIDLLVNCFCNFKFSALLKKYEVINVHLAPLPKYRGRHPMHWALINGEREFGVTVHYMDEDFDSGAILWQRMVPVSIGTSVAQLRQELMVKLSDGFGLFLVDFLKGETEKIVNEDARATYAPRRYPEDSRLTEWQDRDLMFRKVMALRSEQNPAFLRIDNQNIPVLTAKIQENGTTEPQSSPTESRSSASESEYSAMKPRSSTMKSRSSEMKHCSSASVLKTAPDGIEVLCGDGKVIGLYGFSPEKYGLEKYQIIP